MVHASSPPPKPAEPAPAHQFHFFSDLLKIPVCAGKIGDRIGRLSDIVFAQKDHLCEAVGIYLEYGWGKPTQFVP